MAQEQTRNGIDLDKLNHKFEKLLSEETPESFNEFVQKKMQETRKGDGWALYEKLPDFGNKSLIKAALNAQDAYRDKEADALREEIQQLKEIIVAYSIKKDDVLAETIMDEVAYWKGLAEAADRLVLPRSFYNNSFREDDYQNWRRLKNQNQQ